MPTESIIRQGTGVITVTPQEGQSFAPYHFNVTGPTYVFARTKPLGVRRRKPVDLFANGTPWSFSESAVTYQRSAWSTRPDSSTVWSYDVPSSFVGQFISGQTQTPNISEFADVDLKLRMKIKDQKVDLLAAFAEARKTVDLVVGFAGDVIEAYNQLRRGRPSAAVRRILTDPRTRVERGMAKRWLEYQWGLLPVMEDIYGTAEAMSTRLHEGIDYHETATIIKSRTFDLTSTITRGGGVHTTKYRAKARYRVASPNAFTAAALGITNPIASLYQVLPWSFALDWVTNVGDVLEGVDALIGVTNLVVSRGAGQTAVSAYTHTFGGGGAAGYEVRRDRLGVSNELHFGQPQIISFSGSSDRLVNVLALIRQIVHK